MVDYPSNLLLLVHDVNSTSSWGLDHFTCSYDLHVNIIDINCLDKSPSSDRVPVCMKLHIETIIGGSEFTHVMTLTTNETHSDFESLASTNTPIYIYM